MLKEKNMRDFWRSFIEMFMFMFLKSTHLEVCRFENCLEWSRNNFIFCKEQKKDYGHFCSFNIFIYKM